jgi:hypothetical protein
MKRTATFAALILAGTLALPALAFDRDGNPPGPVGGPGTNWENPPGPKGGAGASPDRHGFCKKHPHKCDRDGNPPGPRGGPGTNWENPPGPRGGAGASPDRH